MKGSEKMKKSVTIFLIVIGIGLVAAIVGMALVPRFSFEDSSKLTLWSVYDEQIKSARFVDLTHTFNTTTPVWEGFSQMKTYPACNPKTGEPYTIPKDGFKATVYTHVGQYGTHCDPPAHFDENGMTLDKIPVKQMILPLCVIDITSDIKKDPNHQCSVEDIKEWEKEHGRIPEGSFVALRTDMYKDWQTNPERFKRYPFPAWSMEAIQSLYNERNITANGHESMDTDILGCKVENWLLDHGHWQIECMANLDKIPEAGALIVVTWPNPENGDGFPARAFAICPLRTKLMEAPVF